MGRLGLWGLFVLSLCGCAPQLPNLQRLAPLPSGSICRVAVLPFSSDSGFPFAADIAYKVFSAQLVNLGDYFVVQEGDVRALFQQFRILPGQSPNQEQLKVLALRLNVQLLITGNVIEMRENPGENRTVNPVLAMEVQILDARTAVTLWSVYHRRQGVDYKTALHFGQIHSVTDLCRQVSLEILDLSFKQGLTRCDVPHGS